MSRLFTSGFELGSAASAMEWPTPGSFFGGATVGSTGSSYLVHSGSYSMRIDAPSSGVAQGCSHAFAIDNQNLIVARAYVVAGTDWVPPNVKTTIMALYSSALVFICGVAWDQNGDIYFETEDETLLTINGGAVAPASGQIHQAFEILLFRVDGAGNDAIVFRSVGPHEGISPTFPFTGKSFSAGVTTFAVGANLRGEACTAGRWYFDDVAVNDVLGTVQNSWPGPGMISVLTVNADGDQANKGTQGTDFDTYPSAGGTAYQQLDETPTPDDDTSALLLLRDSRSTTDPPVLDFDLTAALSVIPANARITAVQVGCRVRSITGDNPNSLILRVKSASGGTVIESNPIPIFQWANYLTHLDRFPRNYQLTAYDNPSVPGQPFTPAMLDGAQIGVRMILPGDEV